MQNIEQRKFDSLEITTSHCIFHGGNMDGKVIRKTNGNPPKISAFDLISIVCVKNICNI